MIASAGAFAPVMDFYTRLCEATPLPSSIADAYEWIYVSMDGASHPNRFVAIHSFVQHMLLFWCISLPLLALDVYQWPRCLYKYKIQKATHASATLWHCARNVFLNQLFVLLPVSCFVLYPLYAWRGCGFSVETLPSW